MEEKNKQNTKIEEVKNPKESKLIKDKAIEAISTDNLKLLAVSKAAKILGIRHQTVNSLIQEGKIKVVSIGKRMKIPYFELKRFLKENLEVKQTNNSKVQINFGKPKFKSESNSFDSKALACKIIGGNNGDSN